MKKMKKEDVPAITSFNMDHSFLSNFPDARIRYMKKDYPTLEHAYQAAKSTDENEREKIRLAETAGKAKRYGRAVKALRPDWEEVKFKIMKKLLHRKFRIPELRAKLLATGDAYLSEGNWWHDQIWGDCTCSKCKAIPGRNMLGKLLMEVRSEIRAGVRHKTVNCM